MPEDARPWAAYLLECRGAVTYLGISPDPQARLERHQAGKAALHTRLNPPTALVGVVWFASRREAAVVERKLKKQPLTVKRAWFCALSATTPANPARLEDVVRLLGF